MGSLLDAGIHEHLVVQIALVHLPQVEQTERDEQAHHGQCLQLASFIKQEQQGAHDDDEERAPAVGSEHRHAHLSQILGHQVHVVGIDIARQPRHVAIGYEVEERSRQQGEEQAESSRQPEGCIHIFYLLCQQLRLIDDLLQGEHRQQRYGELCHDEYRRYRAELGIQRHMVDEEVGQAHEVFTPRQQDAQHRSSQKSPFHRAFYDEEPENEEKHNDSTYIDGTRGARLVTPVHADAVVVLRVLPFLHSDIAVGQWHGGTAFGIGDKEGECLIDAIGPLGDVFGGETRLCGGAFGSELTASAHGLLAVFVGVVEIGEVGADGYGCCHEHRRGAFPECAHRLVAQSADEVGYPHKCHHGQEVIGHLQVVAQYLECQEQCQYRSTPEITPLETEHHTGDGGWNECKGKQFPYVTCTYYNKEIGGESDTRIIIKVGYNLDKNWDKKPNNVYYNSDLKMYVFSFPNDEKKLNYTYVDLTTKGVNEGDNVKYCYGTNIGSAIIPSAENCYRVSKDNEYILKFLNPFVMHKEYEIEDKLVYYISIKPVVSTEQKEVMEVIPKLYEYDVKERNFEEVGKNIKIDSSGKASTILTPPKFHQDSIFVQIQNCNLEPISVSFSNAYNKDSILNKKEISKGKNFFEKFENTFFETELHIEGPKDNNVFVKHVGTYDFIDLKFKEEPLNITYNSDLSQIEIERPTDKFEEMNYTVFIAKSGELKNKGFTLCSFAEKQQISQYNKTVRSYNEIVPININFKKFDLKVGDTFEVLVYIEQLSNFQMEFLSEVFTFTVGEIKTDVVIPINKIYEKDTNYVYAEGRVEKDQKSYYYSYLPESISDVPVGSFSIELDSEKEYVFSRVECAFVDEDEDEKSMIDAIQDVVDSYNSYCTGGKSVIDGKTYNYIFRYTYKGDKPRRLVIKLFNDYAKSDSDFTIYIRKGENTFITPTNFEEEKEYGEQDENKKSIMPYIVDLEQIRGNSETDYISKILIYSKYFEMQMYILDETLKTNAPLKIFSGNIMLLYTKLDLAKEKYRSTKLILLCEDLFGQKETPQGTTFRFHTKMFKSDFPIEYYLYNNPVGLYYSYPLSFQINTCSETNNKAYYIINYNKALQEVTFYLDILFGSAKKIGKDNNVNSEK